MFFCEYVQCIYFWLYERHPSFCFEFTFKIFYVRNNYTLCFMLIFQMAQPKRVLGVCLIHCTGTTAGFMESLKDKVSLENLQTGLITMLLF